ncbi:hypothetical protein [Paraburkholderia bryophila]|uniref:Awr type III effector family protein n=1 Tax=Paraburkholderia bryophila TaxID=420952 RepID=A0A7Y9W3B9_9BURK|nr:hypothetical protein [Paraburkholderia bryophila]NYH12975.1 hypothetical protein [Paraburkholderia bryophila]
MGDTRLAWQAYDAAATLTTQGRGALNADQKGAFFAWRQNFRDDGRGSDLSQARERLNKFSAKTIDRVGENRWKSFFPRLVGKRSSPLSALRFGTQGVPRKTVGAEQAKLEDGMRQALTPLCERPEMRAAAALSHARPEQSIAELAALHVWLEAGGFPNGQLDAGQLHQVTERAQQLCAELQPRDVGSPATLDRLRAETARWANTDPHTLARSKPFKSIAKQPFNLERLASWGKVAKVPADSPFWTQVSSLKDRARPPTPAADAESAGAVRQTLKDVAHDLQSSSRLRLTDGSRIGVSTRGLSANLSKVLHAGAVPIAPRLDLRASKTREAVVELSRGTHGVEMFVGTAKTQVQHAGVGVLVGYDVDVGPDPDARGTDHPGRAAFAGVVRAERRVAARGTARQSERHGLRRRCDARETRRHHRSCFRRDDPGARREFGRRAWHLEPARRALFRRSRCVRQLDGYGGADGQARGLCRCGCVGERAQGRLAISRGRRGRDRL